MKQIFANISVARWPFGFVKSFERQHFEERLKSIMPDKTKCGDNEAEVKAAFATAVLMLAKIWDNPSSLSRVARSIRVWISFNNDYSTWMVEIAPYEFGPHQRETHPDFKASVEKEENQIIEKYGFVAEKQPEKKYEVFFRGRRVVMSDEQLDNFRKDIVAMYPNDWFDKFSFKEVEVDNEKRTQD